MKEKEILQKIQDKEDRLLLSYTLDQYHRFQKTGISTCTNFLNERELSFLKNMLSHLEITYQVYWQDERLERNIIYFGESNHLLSIFEISNIKVRHSDVLGTLYKSGFSTSMIGDIFIFNDKVYLTNLEKYDFLLETSLEKIGKNKVFLEKVDKISDLVKREFETISMGLTSIRFDLVVSHLGNMSRSKTLEYIKTKKVFLNYKPLKSASVLLKEKDIFSIEKIGKFKLESIEFDEKKKRFRVLIKRYS